MKTSTLAVFRDPIYEIESDVHARLISALLYAMDKWPLLNAKSCSCAPFYAFGSHVLPLKTVLNDDAFSAAFGLGMRKDCFFFLKILTLQDSFCWYCLVDRVLKGMISHF